MPHRLEITLKPDLFDAEGQGICTQAADYFDIHIDAIRTVQVITMDAALSREQLETVRTEIFTNPVIQESSYDPLPLAFDWCIWVGYRPGVKDNPGSTAVEAMEDVLKIRLAPAEDVYTSRRYCLTGSHLTRAEMDLVARELLSNDIIQQVRVFSKDEWDPQTGIG
ncbi:MAG: phosphoribosylformylglycinamidine synthase subunit PurS, partial [Desulfobacterales bacterium]